MKRLKNFLRYYSSNHAYTEYSLIKASIWKIGVIRRLLGDMRSSKKNLFTNLSKLNHKHKLKFPKPALILAGGPSLNEIDSKFITNFKKFGDTFSTNYFPFTKIGLNCEIDYHVMIDVGHFTEIPAYEYEKKFRNWLLNEFSGKLITQIGAKVNYQGETIFIRGLVAPSFSKSVNPMGLAVGFQPYTALYAISVATWLGYDPVYVSGLDSSQHAFITVSDGKVILSTHHADKSHPAANERWVGRPNSTSILSANAYVIEKMKLFKKYSVLLVGNGSHIDTIPRVSLGQILARHLHQK
jgi:hypothetical protein